ncbi:MAG: hypothetical protein KC457_21810, partial [Myxococcales bacterium]|nr:hypothetical protein [Myxococcales bacterium]
FANTSGVWLPQVYGRSYPFDFAEMGLQRVVAMTWVERYRMLLVVDEHALSTDDKRLQRELDERVHLRLLDFEAGRIWPWIKAIPHGDAFHLWNERSESMSSYFHRGSPAIVQGDASLLWLEQDRARLLRLGDGMLALAKHGGVQSPEAQVHFLDPLGTEAGRQAGFVWRPDRHLDRRHEPLAAMRGPYVVLLVGSSLSALSDRIGNYSLGRVLERELQIELGYRDRVRLDLFQRSSAIGGLEDELALVEEFIAGGGPAPDIILLELADAGGDFSGPRDEDGRRRALAQIEALAERHESLVILYDNSALDADGRDGLRPASASLQRFADEARAQGLMVVSPGDRLLRELMHDSPWGNQSWAPGRHHGAPWAIDHTARLLATTSYPVIHDFLLEREPARVRAESDPGGAP